MKLWLIIIVFLFCPFVVRAEYVLPYPGPMPGSSLYTFTQIKDRVEKYWHWGNIAKVKYYMTMSDKRIVEAKTLFEYKQYLLGLKALKESDEYILPIKNHLDAAKNEGKEVAYLLDLFRSERSSHIDILMDLMETLPDNFTWTPENDSAQELLLHFQLQQSIDVRQ